MYIDITCLEQTDKLKLKEMYEMYEFGSEVLPHLGMRFGLVKIHPKEFKKYRIFCTTGCKGLAVGTLGVIKGENTFDPICISSKINILTSDTLSTASARRSAASPSWIGYCVC